MGKIVSSRLREMDSCHRPQALAQLNRQAKSDRLAKLCKSLLFKFRFRQFAYHLKDRR